MSFRSLMFSRERLADGAGVAVATGDDGAGAAVATGDVVAGAAVATGDDGGGAVVATGDGDAAGAAGVTGAAGAAGATGASGSACATGASATVGATGASGAAAATGTTASPPLASPAVACFGFLLGATCRRLIGGSFVARTRRAWTFAGRRHWTGCLVDVRWFGRSRLRGRWPHEPCGDNRGACLQASIGTDPTRCQTERGNRKRDKDEGAKGGARGGCDGAGLPRRSREAAEAGLKPLSW